MKKGEGVGGVGLPCWEGGGGGGKEEERGFCIFFSVHVGDETKHKRQLV
ncbi:MAG: hypothetical protein GY714_29110 [Desulfobacterales bacterium]|nr:hypothetical protein [Desulfobacterales bacterium]